MFEDWLREVSYLCYGKYGLDTSDLPDMPYMDWYEDGITADEAMELINEELAYEGWGL